MADEIVDHVPAVCAGCQADLAAGEDVGHLVRQVFDLPQIRLRSIEHRVHRHEAPLIATRLQSGAHS